MKNKFYKRKEWFSFADKIKSRDNYTCVKCGRKEGEVVLQVHHKQYIKGKKPWEYDYSYCETLCKGCHAREHKLIEPSADWVLVEVHDLNSVSGTCERANCGQRIRYEFIIYHPECGYKVVGSTCIDYLSKNEQEFALSMLKHYKSLYKFLKEARWRKGETKNKKIFLESTYKHNLIRIYKANNGYITQVALKRKGVKFYDYQDFSKIIKKDLNIVKGLAFIYLMSFLVPEEEKEELRKMYLAIANN